jgi:hypothetical protein
MAGQTHGIVAIALAYVRCVCGWEFRPKKLKGKSDEDLTLEVGGEFEKHKKSAPDKW